MFFSRRCVRKNIHLIVCAVVVVTLTFMTGMWIGEVKKEERQHLSATSAAKATQHPDNNNYDVSNRPLKNQLTSNREEDKKTGLVGLDKVIPNPAQNNRENVKGGDKTKPMAYKLRKDGSRVYYFEKWSTVSSGSVKLFDYPRLKFNRTYLQGTREDRVFLEFRQLDSPAIGDVHCAGTAVEHSCAFYIQSIDEGKSICKNLRHNCKGFVLTTEGKTDGTSEYLAYMKTDVGNVATNLLTDFFVKTEFIKEVKWRPPAT